MASYCLAKLLDINIPMVMQPKYLRQPAHVRDSERDTATTSGQPVLELLCNGMVRLVGLVQLVGQGF